MVLLDTPQDETWSGSDILTATPKFYYPADYSWRHAMYLIIGIAAILDETNLSAGDQADAICQEIRMAILPDAEEMPGGLPKSIPQKIEDLSNQYFSVPKTPRDYSECCWGPKRLPSRG